VVAAAGFLFPVFYDGIFAIPLDLKDDMVCVGYNRQPLQAKVKALKKKIQIEKNLIINEKCNSGIMRALGNSILPGKAGILVDPVVVSRLNEPRQEFSIAHELFHIKLNDAVTINLLAAAVTLVAAIALTILFPHLPFFSVTMQWTPLLVGFVAQGAFSKFCEKRADLLALSVCSEDAKNNAYKLFEGLRVLHKQHREATNVSILVSLWRRITITPDGDYRLGFAHPSFSERVRYLKPQAAAA